MALNRRALGLPVRLRDPAGPTCSSMGGSSSIASSIPAAAVAMMRVMAARARASSIGKRRRRGLWAAARGRGVVAGLGRCAGWGAGAADALCCLPLGFGSCGCVGVGASDEMRSVWILSASLRTQQQPRARRSQPSDTGPQHHACTAGHPRAIDQSTPAPANLSRIQHQPDSLILAAAQERAPNLLAADRLARSWHGRSGATHAARPLSVPCATHVCVGARQGRQIPPKKIEAIYSCVTGRLAKWSHDNRLDVKRGYDTFWEVGLEINKYMENGGPK